MTSTIVHHDIDWCHLDFSDMPDDFDFLEVATECAEHTYQHNAALYAQLRVIDKKRTRQNVRKGSKIYRHRHPEKIKARAARYRIKSNKSNSYSAEDVKIAFRSQKGQCWHCGEKLGEDYHVDHLIPLARGGTNSPRNIVVCCKKCNLEKHAKLCMEWNGRLF